MAKVSFRQVGSALVAHLSGEIGHHAAEILRQEIEHQLELRPVDHLCLDFGGVGFMDSSGVGLILGRARRMRAAQGKLSVTDVPRSLGKMLDLAGIPYTTKEDKQ